jgi:hypothetical protein
MWCFIHKHIPRFPSVPTRILGHKQVRTISHRVSSKLTYVHSRNSLALNRRNCFKPRSRDQPSLSKFFVVSFAFFSKIPGQYLSSSQTASFLPLSPSRGDRSVGIVRSRTQATEFSSVFTVRLANIFHGHYAEAFSVEAGGTISTVH